jgi:hypothetical protein
MGRAPTRPQVLAQIAPDGTQYRLTRGPKPYNFDKDFVFRSMVIPTVRTSSPTKADANRER